MMMMTMMFMTIVKKFSTHHPLLTPTDLIHLSSTHDRTLDEELYVYLNHLETLQQSSFHPTFFFLKNKPPILHSIVSHLDFTKKKKKIQVDDPLWAFQGFPPHTSPLRLPHPPTHPPPPLSLSLDCHSRIFTSISTSAGVRGSKSGTEQKKNHPIGWSVIALVTENVTRARTIEKSRSHSSVGFCRWFLLLSFFLGGGDRHKVRRRAIFRAKNQAPLLPLLP